MLFWYADLTYYRRTWCSKKITWSHSRGDCRFEKNHSGPCKPGARRV